MAMRLSLILAAILAMLAVQEICCVRTRITTHQLNLAQGQINGANAVSRVVVESGKQVPINEIVHTNRAYQSVPDFETVTDLIEEEGSLINRTAAIQDKDSHVGAHALIEASVEQYDHYTKGGDSVNIARGQLCCCRPGRCHVDEIEQGFRPKRNNASEMMCCVFRHGSCSGMESDMESRSEYCECAKEQAIENELQKTHGECRTELEAFIKEIRRQVGLHNHDWLHESAIDAIRVSKAATDITYRLLVKGEKQFDEDSIGANLFRHRKDVTMLWNEINKDNRAEWKNQLGAAELSRGEDVAFARVIDHEDVGQLRSCDDVYDLSNLWYIASATFAGVAPQKPLLLIVGKNNEKALRKTQFWKGELLGVVENPPANGMSIVSVGDFKCDDLMPVLTRAIEDKIPGGPAGARLNYKWFHISSYTCREAKANEPDNFLGRTYTRPGSVESVAALFPNSDAVKDVRALLQNTGTVEGVVELVRLGLATSLEGKKPTLLFKGSVYKQSEHFGSNQQRWVEVISFKDGNRSLITCVATRKAEGSELRDLFFVSSAMHPTHELIGGGFFEQAQQTLCIDLTARKFDKHAGDPDFYIPGEVRFRDLAPLRFCGEAFVGAVSTSLQ